jgi:hypothetical protein
MGKSGFASAVGSCNDDDFFQQEPLAILRFEKQFYVRRIHLLKPVSTIRLELKNKDFYGSKRVSARKKPLQLLARAFCLAPRPGLEPGTYGLTEIQARQKHI